VARIQIKQDWEAGKADPVEFARKFIKGPGGNPLWAVRGPAADIARHYWSRRHGL